MRSMTGYGQASVRRAGRSLSVEIRAVNQRFLDVRFNMPREFLACESDLRAVVKDQVSRGKVDISIARGRGGSAPQRVEPDLELARAYVAAWQKLQRAVHLPGPIDMSFLQARGTDLLRVVEGRTDPSEEIEMVRAALQKALHSFNRDRQREGRTLAQDMLARVRVLEQLQRRIAKHASAVASRLTARLRERMATLLAGTEVSEQRIVQEAALLAERSDVTEELVRLQSHLGALEALLKGDESIGKKIDFLLQEVHREVNTIASKSADLAVTNLTVDARAEIERLREQAQNIE